MFSNHIEMKVEILTREPRNTWKLKKTHFYRTHTWIKEEIAKEAHETPPHRVKWKTARGHEQGSRVYGRLDERGRKEKNAEMSPKHFCP